MKDWRKLSSDGFSVLLYFCDILDDKTINLKKTFLNFSKMNVCIVLLFYLIF